MRRGGGRQGRRGRRLSESATARRRRPWGRDAGPGEDEDGGFGGGRGGGGRGLWRWRPCGRIGRTRRRRLRRPARPNASAPYSAAMG
uniref:Uncharacterized protein n=1 Tax=Oryza glumipatula TaxID=40148 RepID=A0A0E0A9K3_9ORYZ